MLGMEECLMLMPSIFGESLFDDFFDGFGRSSNGAKGYSNLVSSGVYNKNIHKVAYFPPLSVYCMPVLYLFHHLHSSAFYVAVSMAI
jgi:hypothetical protein